MLQDKTKHHRCFADQCVFPSLLYYSSEIFVCFLKNYFSGDCQLLAVCPSLPLNYLISIYSQCEKLVQKFRSDPTHPVHSDLSKCRSRVLARSAFRSIPSSISIRGNSIVSFVASIFTNRDRLSFDFLTNRRKWSYHFWTIFFTCDECNYFPIFWLERYIFVHPSLYILISWSNMR